MFKSISRGGPVRLLACWATLVAGSSCGSPAWAQFTELPPSSALYETLQHRSAEQMEPADASVVREKQRQITDEAAFFGYYLNLGGWNYDQALCSDIPDYVVLHYVKESPGGGESLFTALLPRGQGRVLIVPVLYRNAMPYRSAVGAKRTLEVFNLAVPAAVAEAAAQPGGNWLALAMTYAAVAGAEPNVPLRPDSDEALVKAPRATSVLSVSNRVLEVTFTDRDAKDRYAVWTVDLDKTGRATGGSVDVHADAVARLMPPPGPPNIKQMPAPAPAKMKLMPSPVPPVLTPVKPTEPAATPGATPPSN
jgi:hypothetical protein